ncbi:MAG: hypothetical protein JWM33_2714 [Caulobacteraceae bacterium]|nr:hypothetical protein [Caulobacteraceae bacterium]
MVQALLEDMRAECVAAIALVKDRANQDIADDPVLSRALALSLILVGEAANQIPLAFREAHPVLAWNQARGLRNRIVHGYRTIVPDILIETARQDLPELIQQIDTLLTEQAK